MEFNKPIKLVYTQSKDLKEIRAKLLENENSLCPVLKTPLKMEDAVVDHHHKFFKDQEVGVNKVGCIRGVLDFRVNALEGKISNSYYRLGLHKSGVSLPDILRNLADYLENNLYYEEFEEEVQIFIHPTEKEKEKKITKTCYAKLVKILNSSGYTKKIPEYPKSGVLTKPLKELFETYNVNIEYYK